MSFIKKLWSKVKSVFSASDEQKKENARKAIELVENIKYYVHHHNVDALTAIIPGTWDDELKEKARAFIPVVLQKLNLGSKCIEYPTTSERVSCALSILNNTTDDAKKALLHSLAILLLRVLADGKITFSDSVYLAQFLYETEFRDQLRYYK